MPTGTILEVFGLAMITHALVISRLNYCNAYYTGLTCYNYSNTAITAECISLSGSGILIW